jgi:GlcNAc-PI de-N-acetylase
VPDICFYLATHPDDALMFRGDQLYQDAHTSGVTIVHVTVNAGDAGRTDGWWQQREAGTIRGLTDAQSPPGVSGPTMTAANGHLVARYAGAGLTAYCLRTPDGNTNGQGFPSTHGETLGKLASGAIRSLHAVDGSTTYTSWDDLCATLRAICGHERQVSGTVAPWINASDPSTATNPNDHPDHYAVGDAIRSFAGQDGYQRAWWVSYDVQNRPANLSGFELAAKRFQFVGYGYETGGPNETEWGWWGERDYVRTESG